MPVCLLGATNTSETTSQKITPPIIAGYDPRWIILILLIAAGAIFGLRKLNKNSAVDRGQREVMISLLSVYVLMLSLAPFLPLHGNDWILIDFVAVMTSLGAAFFGFLFGLPQTSYGLSAGTEANDVPAQSSGVRPSTNLETVADQLSKFIAGAAFASVAVAAGYISNFGALVATSLLPPAPPGGALLGDMILVGFSVLGFTIAYIVTRTQLSLTFQQADEKLLRKAFTLISTIIPDIGVADATADDLLQARQVALIAFTSLRSDEERLTWARAQGLVGDWSSAREAYATLYASANTNPDLIIEYATALYNDDPRGNQDLVLSLTTIAERLAGSDARRASRIVALNAATNLYISGGYIKTISTVNDFIRTGRRASQNLRFYRLCAFGQLYRAFYDRNAITNEDDDAILALVTRDAAITMAFGDAYRDQIVNVAQPPSASADDDDLQAFAAMHTQFCAEVLGLSSPPRYPECRDNGEPRMVELTPPGTTPANLASGSPI
jgi:hypothetical protein